MKEKKEMNQDTVELLSEINSGCKMAIDSIQQVGKYVDDKMSETLRATKVSRTDAAVLTALNLADELMKSQQNAENLRSQLKGYLDEANRAKTELSECKREIFKLQQELAKAKK